MVRTSDKQHLLDDIETTIMHSLMVESKMQLDLMDVDATWHPNDDLEDSDDDMFDHAISFALIRTYNIISQSRYTMHSKLSLTDSAQPMPSDQYQAFGMFSSKWQLVYIGLDSQEMVVEFVMLHLPAVAVGAQFIGIVAKPHLHLDEGKFVWVDAGYGYSSYTVGPQPVSRRGPRESCTYGPGLNSI
ncbi:hypothetical protein NDA15_005589 [Ustilago hordei]|nr:hypothetical protein NDA15_005589 [Ustilago hordei]